MDRSGTSPRILLEDAMHQLLRDTTNPRSVIRSHSQSMTCTATTVSRNLTSGRSDRSDRQPDVDLAINANG
jgi:hypothetical protein